MAESKKPSDKTVYKKCICCGKNTHIVNKRPLFYKGKPVRDMEWCKECEETTNE